MNKKVYVISSDKKIVDHIINKLNNFNVKYFDSSEKSLSIIADETPDLVIINLKNEDISGFELCRLIKNTYKIPVITFTDEDELSNLVRAQQEGADACLFIPFKGDELIETINKLI